MWDLPGPGLEPMSPALAGGFLTTAAPGKPSRSLLKTKLLESREVLMTGFDHRLNSGQGVSHSKDYMLKNGARTSQKSLCTLVT